VRVGALIFIPLDEYYTAVTSPAHLDHTLTALADPTRRAILKRLSLGEARVTEVAAPFSISLNSVSKHIRVLERARLVRRRRVGRDHFLSFNPKPMADAARWMDQQRTFWTARLDPLESLLKAEDDPAARPATKRTKR
jgi:DNA-binding transcriptional ArsR family regulator